MVMARGLAVPEKLPNRESWWGEKLSLEGAPGH